MDGTHRKRVTILTSRFGLHDLVYAQREEHPCHDGHIELGLAFAGDHAVRNQRTTQPCLVRLN